MGKSSVVDKDFGWNAMMRRAKELSGGMSVKVGVLASERAGGLHEKDSSGRAKPLTVAEIASVMEFGTRDQRIPERSFIRSTFDRLRSELAADAATLIVKVVVDGSITAETALGILGAKLSTAIKKTVTTGAQVPPPNAPSTARRKQAKGAGAIRTLVDTGRMIGAVSWALVKGGGGAGATPETGGGGSRPKGGGHHGTNRQGKRY